MTLQDKGKRTRLVHGGTARSQWGEVSEALFLTQGFVYENAQQAEARFIEAGPDEYIYARYGNPTVAMFEERMALLEGGEAAFATASGMAAVNAALFSFLKAGDRVVAARALFGSCLYILETLLPQFGVEVVFVENSADHNEWQNAITPGTRLVFFESMSNPTLQLVDIEAISTMAHAAGALVVVDNVFTTPIHSRALAQGADLVVYSATKHIDGQGRVLGGVIVGAKDLVRGPVETYLKHTGAAMSPFTAWVMLKALETLDLRVEAQCANARALAQTLEGQPAFAQVIYPGLPSHPQHQLARRQMNSGGTMVALEMAGGKDAAFALLNALKLFTISNNLGDAKSLITHPATTTHQRLPETQRAALGITDGLLRLSLGIEDSEDLIDDVTQALSALSPKAG